MENVIEAANRFTSSNREGRRETPLDKLSRSAKTKRDDALLIARRLGSIAEQLCPERPKSIVKLWFDTLWEGDRWEKRKRYVLLADEKAPEPMASIGRDWAALIAQAAKSLHPDNEIMSDKARARVQKDVLRGTEFLLGVTARPVTSDSAQALLVDLASKISEAVEARTEMVRLWDTLRQSPVAIHCFCAQDEVQHNEPASEGDTSAHANERSSGDRYSRGPLGRAARRASEILFSRYRTLDGHGYRFEASNGSADDQWSHPLLHLGLVGYRRHGKIFVVPRDFLADLPFDQDVEDGYKDSEDRVIEWLEKNGILLSKPYAKLPQINYSEELGYGWRPFVFDEPRRVWLEVRQSPSGCPGLWVSSQSADIAYCYPVLGEMDALAIESRRRPSWLNFVPIPLEDSRYSLLQWPTDDPDFLIEMEVPDGGHSGLVEIDHEEMPDVEGWLDDLDNVELQDFLFHLAPNSRFCPSIVVDDEVPAPCQAGTVAAALFANAGSDPVDRIAVQLLNQAEAISDCGLEFLSALLAANRERIEAMIPADDD